MSATAELSTTETLCESCRREPAVYSVINPDGQDFEVCTGCAPPLACRPRPSLGPQARVVASHLVRTHGAGAEVLSWSNGGGGAARHVETSGPRPTAQTLAKALIETGHDVAVHTITTGCIAVFQLGPASPASIGSERHR